MLQLAFVLFVNNSWEKNNGVYWCIKNYRESDQAIGENH